MYQAVLIMSPPRIQHLDISTSQSELLGILPEIESLVQGTVHLNSVRIGWRCFRELDEFIINKSLILELDGESLDILTYTTLLANSGPIGDILLYIISKNGIPNVMQMIIVDETEDDVVLSQIVKNAGVSLIDGFTISIDNDIDNKKVYRVISHFMELDKKTASTRCSYLFTQLSSLDINVKLIIMNWNSEVYFIDGILSEEEHVEEDIVEYKKTESGSIEELMSNIEDEV